MVIRILLLAVVLAAPGFPEVVTHLLINWSRVDAGDTHFPVDQTKLRPEDREIIEKVKDYYSIRLSDGPSAPERINTPSNVRLTPEVARKTAPFLTGDKPWETLGVAAGTVLHEGGKFRLWYSCTYAGRDKVVVAPNGRLKLGTEDGGGGMCYAESADGFRWTKPALGLVEYAGNKQNNIVSSHPLISGGLSSIFVDPLAPAAEKYKMMTLVSMSAIKPKSTVRGSVLGGASSPDGIHWTPFPEALQEESFNNDGTPAVFYDAKLRKYVGYFRMNYPRRRSIGRAETADFRHWPVPRLILTPAIDENPSNDFYTNPYFQYPGAENGHLMLVSIYHRDLSTVDMRLASSMDGIGWNWLGKDAAVPLGRKGEWDGGSLYSGSNMVLLPDGNAAIPFTGQSWGHNEWWRVKFESGFPKQSGIAWAVWADGRIAGIESVQQGEFTTLPLKFSGGPIEVNVRTGFSGSVRVELIPEKGPPIASRQIVGDHRWTRLEWQDQPNLSRFAGKTVRLRFHLFDAKVFGFRGEGLESVTPYVVR